MKENPIDVSWLFNEDSLRRNKYRNLYDTLISEISAKANVDRILMNPNTFTNLMLMAAAQKFVFTQPLNHFAKGMISGKIVIRSHDIPEDEYEFVHVFYSNK